MVYIYIGFSRPDFKFLIICLLRLIGYSMSFRELSPPNYESAALSYPAALWQISTGFVRVFEGLPVAEKAYIFGVPYYGFYM